MRIMAFTLAEVLITLGIIGIVAAMTLPSVINKIQNKDKTARLKKFYSSINQAVNRSIVDNGDPVYWVETLAYHNSDSLYDWFDKYIMKYTIYGKSVAYTQNHANNRHLICGNIRSSI